MKWVIKKWQKYIIAVHKFRRIVFYTLYKFHFLCPFSFLWELNEKKDPALLTHWSYLVPPSSDSIAINGLH